MPLFRVHFTIVETGEAKTLDVDSGSPAAAREAAQARHKGQRLAYAKTKLVKEGAHAAHS
ncbi:hypothetical protein H9Q09_00840 [Aurantimonas sp. DM33-3]|uniref:hypothetical protein n=1 Tax=Aurantimonas sp. DM33-3 TaxID=2766955 RepID=UPI0016524B73|nr:hypothetical protein [Aurantimonas sp. DM33-3]MBC6714730.1 hypothetical protein [Aurantimonas sp. DM33-3]